MSVLLAGIFLKKKGAQTYSVLQDLQHINDIKYPSPVPRRGVHPSSARCFYGLTNGCDD
jgi:hypothetical protein